MITGTTPFPGPTTVAFAQQHAAEIPPDILKRNPLCPKALADCIYRCLAKDAKDRYQDPEELQEDLACVAAGRPVAKVHKFKKPKAISGKRLTAIIATTAVVIVLALAGTWVLLTDRVKSDLSEAMRQADVAVASQDYLEAKRILQDAIDATPDRPDRESLIQPASDRLQQIAAKVAEQENQRAQAAAERKQQERLATEAQARREHEQRAIAAVADIKAAIAASDYATGNQFCQ